MTDSTLAERVSQINWFHSIELAPGLVTPGHDETRSRVDVLKLPADLSGKSVLDIGAWDGFFAFEAEGRGAARVLATDSFAWNGSNWSTKAGFELARDALGSRVEDRDLDILDLDPAEIGRFDVVLCLGVLYHMKHPLLALERVAGVTADMLVLETHVDMTWTRPPAAAAFYPGHELGLDPTNWWGPRPFGRRRNAARGNMAVTRPKPSMSSKISARATYTSDRSARPLPRRSSQPVMFGVAGA